MHKIYKNICKKLKDNSGLSMSIQGIIIIFSLFMILYLFIKVMQMQILTLNIRGQIEEATVSMIQKNYANVYHTSREIYSGGYLPNETDFSERILFSENDIESVLEDNIGLTKMKDKSLVKLDSNNEVLYKIKNLKINFINENIESGTQNFTAEVRYKLIFPIYFLGYKKDLEIGMLVKAKHTGKF